MAPGVFACTTCTLIRSKYLLSASFFSRPFLRMASTTKGLVVGVYKEDKNSEISLTRASQTFQSKRGKDLSHLVKLSGLDKKGKCRMLYGLDEEYPSIAVVSLGKKGTGYNELEELDEGRENVRRAVAVGVRNLQENGVGVIDVDPCGDAEAAAEGALLSTYAYEELKAADSRKTVINLNCFTAYAEDVESTEASWQRGTILAEGQILAKRLMEMPANHLTPTRFAEIANDTLGKMNTCTVTVRDRAWAEEKKMGAYLSVAAGSHVPPRFVEVEYSGGRDGEAPFAIVGKGITFDTGGISLKPSASMEEMRADMGGAACTLGALYAAARLKLPINIRGFMPLCENMPGGGATKPGDVVTSMSGKTIQIDNTDAEGRLILCDALTYAQTFNPSGIIDMATLTGAIGVALGAGATGVYSTNGQLWDTLHRAGGRTGDRMWRMPLFNLYSKQVKEAGHLADLNNISHSRAGGSCTAAAFLREFVTHEKWMHLDIAGVMGNKSEVSYLGKGMSGRPTRTVVEFLSQLSRK